VKSKACVVCYSCLSEELCLGPSIDLSCKRKEKTTPFGVNLMRSQVLYRAAQGLKDVEVVLARPVVPPVSYSLQCISAVVL